MLLIVNNVCFGPARAKELNNQRICNGFIFIYTCAISYSANVSQVTNASSVTKVNVYNIEKVTMNIYI